MHLSRRLKCTIVITRCPSSVRLSVRPAVVNFSHFRLLLWNHLIEFKETWQQARSQCPLPSLCFFRADRKNKMAALAPDWLIHFWPLLRNRWREFNETWQEAISQCPLPCFCFSDRSEKQDGGLGLWLVETFSTSPPKPLNGSRIRNSMKFDRKQDLNALYQVCIFRADRKNKMAALPSDWLSHFWLLLWNRLTEFNENCQEARS